MTDIDDIHLRLNRIYTSRKQEPNRIVKSDQVLALMEVLVDEIDRLEDRVRRLERGV